MTASPQSEYLSVRDIRRRLRLVYDLSCHLKVRLPVENSYNSVLTLADIGRYLNEPPSWLRSMRLETPPKHCQLDCRELRNCPKRPTCRNIQPYLQKRLSDFFRAWDAGTVVKARVGDQWQLVHRHPSLAQMAPAAGSSAQARPITGRIELTDQGPRLKL